MACKEFKLDKGCWTAWYVGRRSRDVSFTSDGADKPAAFYLLSYLAHAEAYPTAMVKFARTLSR